MGGIKPYFIIYLQLKYVGEEAVLEGKLSQEEKASNNSKGK